MAETNTSLDRELHLKRLGDHVRNDIIPQYENCDEGHRRDHILSVYLRSIDFACDWNKKHPDEEIDLLMVKIIAVYHDLGLTVADRKEHHLASAKLLLADDVLKDVFTEEQLKIMAEAVEDHRASKNGEPRSIYGCIVSQADRDISADNFLRRMYIHRKNNPQFANFFEIRMDAYKYMTEKYGENGCGSEKFWFTDYDFEDFLITMRHYIANPYAFANAFRRVAAEADNRALAYAEA